MGNEQKIEEGHALNPQHKIGRKKINSMGYIQGEMFWKRFDLADNRVDRIHEGNMKDTLNTSSTNGQWTEEGSSPSHATAYDKKVFQETKDKKSKIRKQICCFSPPFRLTQTISESILLLTFN
jgi:hypothetical protein